MIAPPTTCAALVSARPTSPRPVRRVQTLVLALLLAGAGLTATAAPAGASGHDGYCTDARGTTVVVDFQQLGGGVVIRCATTLPAGATGLDAIRAAGIPYEGVRRYGDAFLCRLYGRPAATASLAVKGSPGYHEQCIDTPPASAYWSYWSASNGGTWTYSQYGVRNRSAVRGGFEGWSFALNSGGGGAPAPRVDPTRPVAPSPHTSTRPAPAASNSPRTTATPTSGSSRPSRTATDRTTGPGSAATTRSTASTAATASTAGSAVASSRSAARSTSPSAGPGTSGSSSPNASGTSALVVSSRSLAEPRRAAQATSPTTVVGAGLLAFLLAAGLGTAWRRRRAR